MALVRLKVLSCTFAPTAYYSQNSFKVIKNSNVKYNLIVHVCEQLDEFLSFESIFQHACIKYLLANNFSASWNLLVLPASY